MRQWTAMTVQQIIKYTKASADRCPACRCFSVRVPSDDSPPFCINDNCAKAWKQDAALRPDRANLHAVNDPDA